MNCIRLDGIERFLDGAGRVSERDAIEHHIAGCADCRTNLTNVHAASKKEFFQAPPDLIKTVKQLPKKETARVSFFSFFADHRASFALGMGLVVVVGLFSFWAFESDNDGLGAGADTLRHGTQNTNLPSLFKPEDKAVLATDRIEFTWRQLNGLLFYKLVISDRKGDIIFQKDTKQNRLTINASEAKLMTGNHYFWYISAKFIDGRLAVTPPRKFSFKK